MNEIDFGARFFYTGGALPPEAPSYISRSADEQLLERLQHGDYCYVLVSRQMGKSSLMVHTLIRLIQQNITGVMVDLNSIGDDLTQEQWYYSLTEQLAGQLGLNEEIDAFWERSEGKTALQKWVGAVEQMLRLYPNRSLVIFIDEIDQVRSLPFKTDEFFAAIRSFHNRRAMDVDFKRISFCLIGVALPSDLIEDPRITPFNIAERIDLADFTEEQVVALKAGLQREEIQEDALLERVFYWTNGHPYLTQRLCRAIVEDASIQMASDVDRLCDHLFFGADAVAPDDNLNLVSSRMLHSDPDVMGLLTLYRRIVVGQSVRYDRANRLVNVLMLAGAVRSVGGLLSVRNRIYADVFNKVWIEDHLPDAENRRQKAAYRAGVVRTASIATVLLLLMSILTGFAIINYQKALKAEAKAQTKSEQNSRLAVERKTALDLAESRKATLTRTLSERDAALKDRTKALADRTLALTDAVTQKHKAENNAKAANIASALADRNAYFANMALIQRDWDTNNIGPLLGLLRETQPYKEKGFEWGYWKRLFNMSLRTFKGHTGAVSTVCFSPDGRRLVTGSEDGTAKIWDVATGKAVLTSAGKEIELKHNGEFVTASCFSPDGRFLLTGSNENTAKLWDAATGQEIRSLKGHPDTVTSVGFSPDSRQIVTGDRDATAKVWDTSTGKEILTLRGHTGYVTSVCFSPDGKRILTGSWDKAVKLWNAATGQEIHTFQGHTGYVTSVCFSPDGKRILTGSWDASARLWNASDGKQLLVLQGHAGYVNSACFSPDGKLLLTGGSDKTARLWDAGTGNELHCLRGHTGYVNSACFSPDGKLISTGSTDKTARLWDAASTDAFRTLNGHTAFVKSVCFSPNSTRILTGSSDKTAKVWSADTGKEIFTLLARTGYMTSVCYSPDGKRILTGNFDKTATVWDASTAKEICILTGHTRELTSVCFSPDGTRILTGSWDKTARLWDTLTGNSIRSLRGHAECVTSVCFSPDGKRILTGSYDKTAKLWDATTGKVIRTLPKQPNIITSVCFSPDGKRFLTGSDDAKLWDTATGNQILVLTGHARYVSSVCFSPNGKRILTGSGDDTAKLWDAATGKEFLTLKGHLSDVYSACFSPDGKHILTGSDDKTAKLWDSTLLAHSPVR